MTDERGAQALDIAHLPAILNFTEEGAPMLERTHRRIIEAARSNSVEKAEAAAGTYRELAEAHIENRLQAEHGDLPPPILKNIQAKARCGVLINIAHIWQEAGVTDRCLHALERAITYARRMRWESIATALELEKRKLQSANA